MKPASGRVEAWEFLMGGGAVYSNLNFAYQVGRETGEHPESNEFKGYLRRLREFMVSFDFIHMRPDDNVIAEGIQASSIGRALSEPGKQYAIYVHHSSYARNKSRYELSEDKKQMNLVLNLPAGSYRLDWIRPSDLNVLQSQMLAGHTGGKVAVDSSPEHDGDIAIRILRK